MALQYMSKVCTSSHLFWVVRHWAVVWVYWQRGRGWLDGRMQWEQCPYCNIMKYMCERNSYLKILLVRYKKWNFFSICTIPCIYNMYIPKVYFYYVFCSNVANCFYFCFFSSQYLSLRRDHMIRQNAIELASIRSLRQDLEDREVELVLEQQRAVSMSSLPKPPEGNWGFYKKEEVIVRASIFPPHNKFYVQFISILFSLINLIP